MPPAARIRVKTKVDRVLFLVMMFIDLKMVVDNGIKIPGIHFQDQNNDHNQILIKKLSNEK
jgi:hypothetical protein